MGKYLMIACRDGDIAAEEFESVNQDVAEARAAAWLRDNWNMEGDTFDEIAADMDGLAVDPVAAAETLTANAAHQYRRLADGLSDMIEGGRLTASDLPDDYHWLTEALASIAAVDPTPSAENDATPIDGNGAEAPKIYTPTLLCEAAMCMWEEVSTHRDDPLWSPLFARYGTPTVRHSVMDLAQACCEAWDALTEEEQEELIPYDWEFCPHFLRNLCEWDDNGPTVKRAALSRDNPATPTSGKEA